MEKIFYNVGINNAVDNFSYARPPTTSLIVAREVTEASELASQAS